MTFLTFPALYPTVVAVAVAAAALWYREKGDLKVGLDISNRGVGCTGWSRGSNVKFSGGGGGGAKVESGVGCCDLDSSIISTSSLSSGLGCGSCCLRSSYVELSSPLSSVTELPPLCDADEDRRPASS